MTNLSGNDKGKDIEGHVSDNKSKENPIFQHEDYYRVTVAERYTRISR